MNRRITCFAIGLSIISANCAADMVISDATFNNADWQLTMINIGSGGSVTATQMPTGGNPTAYRHITNQVDSAPPDGPGGILGLHRFLPATYDPAVQGAILSIDYSEDSKMFSGFGNGQAVHPALWQDGATFITFQRFFANQADWTTQSMLDLTPSDFFLLLPDGNSDLNQHPDFSVAGAPIGFGYERDDSTPVGGIGYTIVAGIDNWSMTVTSVPESSSLSLMAISACSLLVSLWRRTTGAGPVGE